MMSRGSHGRMNACGAHCEARLDVYFFFGCVCVCVRARARAREVVCVCAYEVVSAFFRLFFRVEGSV